MRNLTREYSNGSMDYYQELVETSYRLNKRKNREYVDDHKLDFHIVSENNVRRCHHTHDGVAVFIYLYYIEDVMEYASYLNDIPKDIPLYVISPINEIRGELDKFLHHTYMLIGKENRGRDMSGLLVAAREYILNYEIICFVHDKRGKENDSGRDADIWRENLWSNALGRNEYINNVVDFLMETPDVGLLVPGTPIAKRTRAWIGQGWSGDFDWAVDVRERIGLNIELDENGDLITYGTVFWARTDALKKLFMYEWKYSDFPVEPLAPDGTISHAIERLLGYIAADAGYKVLALLNVSFVDLYIKQLFKLARGLKNDTNELKNKLKKRELSRIKEQKSQVEKIKLDHYKQKNEKYQGYWKLFDKWMTLNESGISLIDIFREKKWNKVIIYGLGMFGRHLVSQLDSSDIQIVFGIDQKEDKCLFDFDVYSLESAPKMDVPIVVTVTFDYDKIKKDLRNVGFNGSIISLESLIDLNG